MRKLWAHKPNSAICIRQTSFALVNLSPRELSQPAPEERDINGHDSHRHFPLFRVFSGTQLAPNTKRISGTESSRA